MTTATVTRHLKAEGLPVTLYRGNGYHYFVFDDGKRYEERSIMEPHFRAMSVEQWLADGREFAAEVMAKEVTPAGAFVLKIGGRK